MAEETTTAVMEAIDLDILDSSLIQEEVQINVDANPMEQPPPVDDGVHRVKLFGDPKKWFPAETKENKNGEKTSYLKTSFYGVVIAEGTKNNNKRVFKNWISTLVFDGKSEMAYVLLQIYGGKGNPEARAKVEKLKNFADLAKAFRDALAGEPVIKVSTKWFARYNAGTKEKPDYKTAKSGQTNFPSDGAGGRRHIINVPNIGDLAAMAEIQDYFPD
jgi:hypothetical protein